LAIGKTGLPRLEQRRNIGGRKGAPEKKNTGLPRLADEESIARIVAGKL
jgi:hypothetical protein